MFMFTTISEDDVIPPLPKKDLPKSAWDDEDVDENDVKDSWEDEDELAPVWHPLSLSLLYLLTFVYITCG